MHKQLVPVPIRLTYDDYAALPEDRNRYEIIDGDLHASPAPMTNHQRTVMRLIHILQDHVSQGRLGEVFVAPYDVLLGEHDVVQPDIVFVSAEHAGIITEKNIQGVPDLLIEVLSTSKPQLDLRDKRQAYSRCGVPWYWIVDPWQRRVIELQLVGSAYAEVVEVGDGDTFTPERSPGLSIRVADLWGQRP